jgi:hypothetical protein
MTFEVDSLPGSSDVVIQNMVWMQGTDEDTIRMTLPLIEDYLNKYSKQFDIYSKIWNMFEGEELKGLKTNLYALENSIIPLLDELIWGIVHHESLD